MNFPSLKTLLLSLMSAAALITQLGGCDRRPVTAEQPGASNSAPSDSVKTPVSPTASSKSTPGNGSTSK